MHSAQASSHRAPRCARVLASTSQSIAHGRTYKKGSCSTCPRQRRRLRSMVSAGRWSPISSIAMATVDGMSHPSCPSCTGSTWAPRCGAAHGPTGSVSTSQECRRIGSVPPSRPNLSELLPGSVSCCGVFLTWLLSCRYSWFSHSPSPAAVVSVLHLSHRWAAAITAPPSWLALLVQNVTQLSPWDVGKLVVNSCSWAGPSLITAGRATPGPDARTTHREHVLGAVHAHQLQCSWAGFVELESAVSGPPASIGQAMHRRGPGHKVTIGLGPRQAMGRFQPLAQ
jgi:hypothetical protein